VQQRDRLENAPPGTLRQTVRSALERLGGTRTGFLFILAVTYCLVAAAVFHGYYEKWKMSDFAPPQSLTSMLDGTAARPYVYRQLLPQLATTVERALPEGARTAIVQRLVDARGALRHPSGQDAAKDGYVLRYRIVYYATFFCLLTALFVQRSICLAAGLNEAAAAAAPLLFALMIPILQTRGGFFYDYVELLTFSLAARFAIGGHIVPLLLLAAPATANKESFLFYCLALPPLLMHRLSMRNAMLGALTAAFVSGITYLGIRMAYAGNPGSNAIFQLFDTLPFYANPLNLIAFDQTYGLPLFKGYGLIVFAWFGLLMTYGWRQVPRYIQDHLKLAAIINIPLFLLFCAEGEMRNLSMLFVSTIVLIGAAAQRWLQSTHALIK